MNMKVQILLQDPVFNFLDKYQEVRVLDRILVLLKIFWATSIQFSMVATPFYIPTNNPHQHFLFSAFFSFYQMWCNIWLWFCLQFLNTLWCWKSFHIPGNHLYVVSEKRLFKSFAHFKIGFFSCYWIVGIPYIFWIFTAYQIYDVMFNFRCQLDWIKEYPGR